MKFNKLIPELLVSEVERSKEFYIGKLGFEIQYDRPEEGFCLLEKDGSQLMLEQLQPDSRFTNTFPEMPFGRGMNLQMEVLNVDKIHKNLLNSNYPIFSPMEEKWYKCGDFMGGNRQFVVADPDGYLLRFFKDLGEKPI